MVYPRACPSCGRDEPSPEQLYSTRAAVDGGTPSPWLQFLSHLFETRHLPNGDRRPGHDFADGEPALADQIGLADNADHPTRVADRQSTDVVECEQLRGFVDAVAGGDADHVGDHDVASRCRGAVERLGTMKARLMRRLGADARGGVRRGII